MSDLKIGDKVRWKEGNVFRQGKIVDVQTVIRKKRFIGNREVAMPGSEWIVEDKNGKLYSIPSGELSFGEN